MTPTPSHSPILNDTNTISLTHGHVGVTSHSPILNDTNTITLTHGHVGVTSHSPILNDTNTITLTHGHVGVTSHSPILNDTNTITLTHGHVGHKALPHRRQVLLPPPPLQRRVHPLDHHGRLHALPHKLAVQVVDCVHRLLMRAHGHQPAALQKRARRGGGVQQLPQRKGTGVGLRAGSHAL